MNAALPATLLLLLAAPVAPVAPDEEAEAEARALLAEAEERVRDGRHDDAVRLYERIVRRYPGTSVAVVAERRSRPNAFLGWADVVRAGPSENRVDVVVMGDGYELDDLDSFDELAEDVPRIFERDEVFEEYLAYLNVLRADVVSAEGGIDAFGRERDTALGGAMSGGDQGQVTVDREAVRTILRRDLPDADGMAIVLVPRGSLGTGGGGVAAVAAREFATMIHEWGHAFADLQDEYSTRTGFRGRTRSSINVSDTDDPERVPWAHFIEAGVRGVGVYEGADGKVRGAWKPTTAGCVMGSGGEFCPVCREAIVLRIHAFVDPIDGASPDPREEVRLARDGDRVTFELRVMEPASHDLEVSWWLFPAGAAPEPARYEPAFAAEGRRAARGPLAPIERDPDEHDRSARGGRSRFALSPRDLEPGAYLLFARAEDTTELRGERWPWVLKDPHELLRSERVWRVIVE